MIRPSSSNTFDTQAIKLIPPPQSMVIQIRDQLKSNIQNIQKEIHTKTKTKQLLELLTECSTQLNESTLDKKNLREIKGLLENLNSKLAEPNDLMGPLIITIKNFILQKQRSGKTYSKEESEIREHLHQLSISCKCMSDNILQFQQKITEVTKEEVHDKVSKQLCEIAELKSPEVQFDKERFLNNYFKKTLATKTEVLPIYVQLYTHRHGPAIIEKYANDLSINIFERTKIKDLLQQPDMVLANHFKKIHTTKDPNEQKEALQKIQTLNEVLKNSKLQQAIDLETLKMEFKTRLAAEITDIKTSFKEDLLKLRDTQNKRLVDSNTSLKNKLNILEKENRLLTTKLTLLEEKFEKEKKRRSRYV